GMAGHRNKHGFSTDRAAPGGRLRKEPSDPAADAARPIVLERVEDPVERSFVARSREREAPRSMRRTGAYRRGGIRRVFMQAVKAEDRAAPGHHGVARVTDLAVAWNASDAAGAPPVGQAIDEIAPPPHRRRSPTRLTAIPRPRRAPRASRREAPAYRSSTRTRSPPGEATSRARPRIDASTLRLSRASRRRGLRSSGRGPARPDRDVPTKGPRPHPRRSRKGRERADPTLAPVRSSRRAPRPSPRSRGRHGRWDGSRPRPPARDRGRG